MKQLYCTIFYDGINDPEVTINGYLCDRCECQPLIEYEFYNFIVFRDGFTNRYCTECWNWIHLMKWVDENGNKHTLRSERRY